METVFADRDVEGVVVVDAARIDLSAAADALAGHLGARRTSVTSATAATGSRRSAAGSRVERVDPACLALPDALVCADDLVALGVLEGRANGAGCGFRTTSRSWASVTCAFARSAQPSLTTVRLPERALGVALAEEILARRAGQPAARVALSAKLVVRRSTGGLFHVEREAARAGAFHVKRRLSAGSAFV